MSRLLKRPMFRKGGSTNEGIMSGMQRENFAEKGMSDEMSQRTRDIVGQIEAQAGNDYGYDPLTAFLLSYGPKLAKATPTGKGVSGFLTTASGAAEEPLKEMIRQKAEEAKTKRNIRTGAAQIAIEQIGKEKLLEKELAGKMAIAQLKTDTTDTEVKNLAVKLLPQYGNDFSRASEAAKYHLVIQPKLSQKYGLSQIGGLIEQDLSDPKIAQNFVKANKNKIGKVFYDINTGQIKKLSKDASGNIGFIVIDSLTSPATKEAATTTPTVTEAKKDIPRPSSYLRPGKKYIPKEEDPFSPYGGG